MIYLTNLLPYKELTQNFTIPSDNKPELIEVIITQYFELRETLLIQLGAGFCAKLSLFTKTPTAVRKYKLTVTRSRRGRKKLFNSQYSSRKPAPESVHNQLPLGVRSLQYYLHTLTMCYSLFFETGL